MYQPLISIIIPVYNGENYLQQCIESALGQTYKNLEIIVVNDGSTDNGATERIALAYLDRIRYMHKENGGSSSALNVGIRHMKGEWFSWLSHDDLYHPDKLRLQVEFLAKVLEEENQLDLDRQVVYCDSENIDKDGRVIHKSRNKARDGLSNIELMVEALRNIRLNGCSFLLPRDCFAKVGGFDESLRLLNDTEFWYRLLFHGYRFRYVPEVLVQNRLHKEQISYAIRYSCCNKEQDMFWNRLMDWLEEHEECQRAELFHRVGKYALYCGRDADSERAFQYAIGLDNTYRVKAATAAARIRCSRGAKNTLKRLYVKWKL